MHSISLKIVEVLKLCSATSFIALLHLFYSQLSFSLFLRLLLFSFPVMLDSLGSHGLQHDRPSFPSPSPQVAQVHVHCISDAIQPSYHLMPASPALNLS